MVGWDRILLLLFVLLLSLLLFLLRVRWSLS